MSRTKKCAQMTRPFSFELSISDGTIGYGSVTIEGFACMHNGICLADIDRIEFEGVDIKPVLEMMQGMQIIDDAAEKYVKTLFEYKAAA